MFDEVSGSILLELGDGHRLRVADPVMIETFARIQRGADSKMPVLITGRTGVGKELAARAVHHYSGRTGPLVCINCAGLPDALLENELFGHEQGAFTGALASKPGLFEVARRGTLFLDEIGELPMRSQGALLRVLDGQPVLRLGGRAPIAFDARIVAATNCEMEFAVAAGRFRADLYHRLRGTRLHIPPLSDRRDDIRLLAPHFLDAARDERSRERIPISDAAMRLLLEHDWPGNVRELKHTMTLAAVYCSGSSLEPGDLPDECRGTSKTRSAFRAREPGEGKQGIFDEGYALADELGALERTRIVEALEIAEGVQVKAARILGMPRRTLVRKLRQHRLAARRRDTLSH